MVNQKHISSWAPCLSKRNDRITTTLAAETFPNETWIQAIFQPKSTRNIEGVLCNLSLVSGECFTTNQGQKAGKTWGKNRADVTIALHNTEKKSLSNAEKMKMWREEKIKKKKEADKKHYELNKFVVF